MKESIIYGVLGGVIGSLYLGWVLSPKSSLSQHPTLAVVDMQVLISKKSQQLAKILVSQTLVSESKASRIPESGIRASATGVSTARVSIREAAYRLKEDLNAFATTHNLILLAKGAVVVGDIPDKTEEILALIERGEQS